jgi:hypothetical protein
MVDSQRFLVGEKVAVVVVHRCSYCLYIICGVTRLKEEKNNISMLLASRGKVLSTISI